MGLDKYNSQFSLQVAIKNNNIEIVNYLLDNGADVNEENINSNKSFKEVTNNGVIFDIK